MKEVWEEHAEPFRLSPDEYVNDGHVPDQEDDEGNVRCSQAHEQVVEIAVSAHALQHQQSQHVSAHSERAHQAHDHSCHPVPAAKRHPQVCKETWLGEYDLSKATFSAIGLSKRLSYTTKSKQKFLYHPNSSYSLHGKSHWNSLLEPLKLYPLNIFP